MTQRTLTEVSFDHFEIDGETGRVFVETRARLEDAVGYVVSVLPPHRRPIEPDADVTAEPPEVQSLATLVRTPERLARYEEIKAAAETTRTR